MRLHDIAPLYPTAVALIEELITEGAITLPAVERLTLAALARIDNGTTSRRDARVLLLARQATYERRTQ